MSAREQLTRAAAEVLPRSSAATFEQRDAAAVLSAVAAHPAFAEWAAACLGSERIVEDPDGADEAYAMGFVAGRAHPELNIVARVANGPYTLLVTGDTYEQILADAEAWVEEREGQRFTPTYYTALTSVLWRGVVGTLDEEDGVGTDG